MCFADGLDATNCEANFQLITVRKRRTDFVACGRFAPHRAGHPNALLTDILQLYGAKIANHIRQNILGGIADFVKNLLGNGCA